MSSPRSFLLCFAPLSEGCVAFDAARVEEFDDAGPRGPGRDADASGGSASDGGGGETTRQGDTGVIDLVELLGLPAREADAARRTIVFSSERGPLVVVLGQELRLQSVELDAFLQLPPLLAGLKEKTGVTGFVRQGDELAMFVDIGVLAGIARRRSSFERSGQRG